ncbi:MAG: Dabb family protein [Flavobacteriaceae bacterium]|nr:MAG: Dabb family protein [Flavobacteriaceae bacterium]
MSNEPQSKVLRHIVLFKFKEEVTPMAIDQTVKAFIHAVDQIGTINDFEWGLNNSPEDLNKGFTHAFVLTFEDDKSRDAYLPHPDHQNFVKQLKPLIEDVLVLDYWTK